MALVLNEEQQMLKESAQGFLAEHAPTYCFSFARSCSLENTPSKTCENKNITLPKNPTCDMLIF